MSKKQIFIIIGLIALLIAIPLTLYLARKQQTLKSRASFSTQVDFLDENGNVIHQTSSSRVKLRIRKEVAPSEQPSPSTTASPEPTLSPSPIVSAAPATQGGNAQSI